MKSKSRGAWMCDEAQTIWATMRGHEIDVPVKTRRPDSMRTCVRLRRGPAQVHDRCVPDRCLAASRIYFPPRRSSGCRSCETPRGPYRVEALSAHRRHRRTDHRQQEVVRRDHVLALARALAEDETADQIRNTELMCTAVRLAKSRMPALASQPVGSHTIWAIGE
jgi:hypothetical protein